MARVYLIDTMRRVTDRFRLYAATLLRSSGVAIASAVLAGNLAVALIPLVGYASIWSGYAACMGAGLLLYPGLSREAEAKDPKPGFSARSGSRVARFAGLSAIDSLGSGFLTSALLSYYFYK